MRAKYINEKFEEKSDPIRDMGIGFMPYIKKVLQDIVDEYNLDTEVDEFNNDFYKGYSFLYEKNGYEILYYSITYSENGIEVHYVNNKQSDSNSQKCNTIEEAKDIICGWID